MLEFSGNTAKKFTYNDYVAIDDGYRYELINGVLKMIPGPATSHQRMSLKLASIIDYFIEDNDLGSVFESPIDVILDEENTVQPDILFISLENQSKVKENAIYGAPELVIEIISPSSVKADRYIKKSLYERFGVLEYWIVDIANKTVEVFELADSKFQLFSITEEKGKIDSKLLPGLNIEFDKILQKIKL